MYKPVVWVEVPYLWNIYLGIERDCHECVSHAARTEFGHVQCKRDGFSLLHRWVYWQATGEIPEVVRHLCDNPCCLNLAHLTAGTQISNVQDRESKGRRGGCAVTGNRQTRVLSDAQVREIRELRNEGLGLAVLADKFLVSMMTISRVVCYKSYFDVR